MSSVAERFRAFAAVYPELTLYRRLSEGAANDPDVRRMLLVARAGQERPVLLFAAVHDLVLRHPGLPLAAWYSSVTSPDALATGDPWQTFRATCLDHREELESLIATRSTQTNEANRAVLVAVLLAAACADQPGVPVALVELGASAGLLLGVDRFAVSVGEQTVGDPASPVRCTGEVRGPNAPDLSSFPARIAERVGIDRDPVDLTDPDRVRWLEACLWPDEPWRIERFRAAVDRLRGAPPTVVSGDMIDGLADVIASLDPASHLVMFDVWTLTYVANERRSEVAQILTATAGEGRPVSWVSAEPPGAVPGIVQPSAPDGIEEASADTVLSMRRWRLGREQKSTTLGWAHPHGNWVSIAP